MHKYLANDVLAVTVVWHLLGWKRKETFIPNLANPRLRRVVINLKHLSRPVTMSRRLGPNQWMFFATFLDHSIFSWTQTFKTSHTDLNECNFVLYVIHQWVSRFVQIRLSCVDNVAAVHKPWNVRDQTAETVFVCLLQKFTIVDRIDEFWISLKIGIFHGVALEFNKDMKQILFINTLEFIIDIWYDSYEILPFNQWEDLWDQFAINVIIKSGI